jgi:serine/threonine-protein phosphatase 4 catalytic subunit
LELNDNLERRFKIFLAASAEERGLIGRHPVPDYFL